MTKRNQNEITLGAHGEDYGSWMSMPSFYFFGGITAAVCGLGVFADKVLHKKGLAKAAYAGTGLLCAGIGWMAWTRKQYAFGGGGVMDKIHQFVIDQIDWDGEGTVLEVGCGSGPLAIRAAKTFPNAKVVGIDNWGVMWDKSYSKENCDRNARMEGVADQCTFQAGDATKLDFPDETFDVVISNLVYHNIPLADKQDLLLETLRTLKKGGTFVLQDSIKSSYGDMDAFIQKLKEMGYEDVRLVDADEEIFGSALQAQIYFVGNLKALVGKK